MLLWSSTTANMIFLNLREYCCATARKIAVESRGGKCLQYYLGKKQLCKANNIANLQCDLEDFGTLHIQVPITPNCRDPYEVQLRKSPQSFGVF